MSSLLATCTAKRRIASGPTSCTARTVQCGRRRLAAPACLRCARRPRTSNTAGRFQGRSNGRSLVSSSPASRRFAWRLGGSASRQLSVSPNHRTRQMWRRFAGSLAEETSCSERCHTAIPRGPLGGPQICSPIAKISIKFVKLSPAEEEEEWARWHLLDVVIFFLLLMRAHFVRAASLCKVELRLNFGRVGATGSAPLAQLCPTRAHSPLESVSSSIRVHRASCERGRALLTLGELAAELGGRSSGAHPASWRPKENANQLAALFRAPARRMQIESVCGRDSGAIFCIRARK